MEIEFELEEDKKVYAEWTRILWPVFGRQMALHYDLYESTHAHRLEHAKQVGGQEKCAAWPTPPYKAPMWPLIAAVVKPRRYLEVGCALGYTAALMADAGGTGSRVDTVEVDPLHAEIAEREIARRGLADRVRVLRGDSKDVLPGLTVQYDVVFEDGGPDLNAELRRLTTPGGLLVQKAGLRNEVEAIVAMLRDSAEEEGDQIERARRAAEERYRQAVLDLIEAGRVRH